MQFRQIDLPKFCFTELRSKSAIQINNNNSAKKTMVLYFINLHITRVNALSAIRPFGCARIIIETRWVRSGRYFVSYITISLKYLQTNMYIKEQSVILIHPNARVFTVKAVNSFDIYFLGHFCVYKIITRILDPLFILVSRDTIQIWTFG